MFEPDRCLVVAHHTPDEIVTDIVLALVAAVEEVGKGATAEFGRPCGEGNDFLAYPWGFGAGAHRRSW